MHSCRQTAHLATALVVAAAILTPHVRAADCPELEGRWPYGPASAVALSGDYAFVGSGTVLLVVDLFPPSIPGTPSSPSTVRSYDTDGNSLGVAVTPQGYAYLADSYGGLAVIDATTPAVPVPIGSFDTAGSAERVALYGGRAFVADLDAGVEIFKDCDDTIFADNLETGDASAWAAAAP